MELSNEIQKAYQSILDHDFEKAIEWFEKAVMLQPQNADVRYRLSITFARSNKLQRALEEAQESVRLEPENEVYQYHLQTLNAKQLVYEAEPYFGGSVEELYKAVALLNAAVKMDPLSIEAYLLLAEAYAGLDDYLLAIKQAQEVLRLDPNHELGKRAWLTYKYKLNDYLGK